MQKEKIIQELEELKNDNRLRTIKTNDKSLYNFSSNDYLGLASKGTSNLIGIKLTGQIRKRSINQP